MNNLKYNHNNARRSAPALGSRNLSLIRRNQSARRGWSLLFCFIVGLGTGSVFAAEKPLYTTDFEQATLDQVPEEFLVLDGGFAVKEEGDNRFLELPGSPLETFGVLFGPTERDGLAVSARIYGTNQGRRYPAFSVGLNGVNGYRLQVSPAKRSLELFKGDESVWSEAHAWKPGTWTRLRLQIRKVSEAEWKVEGKAWTEGSPEPEAWMVVHLETTAPYPGRASIWGKPFAGTPIRFDDLIVTAAQP